MARRERRDRDGRTGRFDTIIGLLELLVELLAYAPRLIFGLFRLIFRIFD
ncbi:hypothetical protein [Saccharibacillus alkalitolerans]|uniref:YggT family protein n=1 Tax=Saccharibacillus alkalitolerans TaxID=2705290 RepID=A0ABX0EYU9_9BACL|nr:hypothetical protein [Saccharibacillus alkalitolerans]NGZ73913.1 hypothetical protein [Saccharibacillus alkalitolerans]